MQKARKQASDAVWDAIRLEEAVGCHKLIKGVLFIDCDSPFIADRFGIDLEAGVDDVETWQEFSLRAYRAIEAHSGRLFAPVVGLTYRARQAGCAGRTFALYEDFRDDVLQRGPASIFPSKPNLEYRDRESWRPCSTCKLPALPYIHERLKPVISILDPLHV